MGAILDLFMAMEASAVDVTKEATSEVDKMTGTADAKKDADEDLGKTEDIFGLTDPDPGDTSDETPDTDPPLDEGETPEDVTEDDVPPGEEDLGDDMGENEESLDDMDEGADDTEDPSAQQEEDPEIKQKLALRTNMTMLYNIIENNIKLVGEFAPRLSSSEATTVLYNIADNLSECKEILFACITEDFITKSYPELMKTYVGVNKIYDICTTMLAKHFNNLGLTDADTGNDSKEENPKV